MTDDLPKPVKIRVGNVISIHSEEAEPVFAAVGKLRDDYGISFDTGIDSHGLFDWYLDWSLQHPNSLTKDEAVIKIQELLDTIGLKYTIRIETYMDV